MNIYSSVHDVITVYEKEDHFEHDGKEKTYRKYTFITADGGCLEISAFLSESFLDVKKGLEVGEIENAIN